MPTRMLPATRRSRAAAAATALVAVAAAGLGLWWTLGRDDPDRDCAGLRTDGRIRTVLDGAWRSDLPCRELAEGLRRATTGERPGVHTLPQARAMRTVVLVLADRPDHRVHPEVRGPLAEALADYAADTHAVLTGVNDVYAAHDGPSADAWQDGQGVHFAVRKDQLVGAVRGLAEDASGYAALRAADLRQGAAGLAAVGPGPEQSAIVDPLVRAAAPAGAFDGIADDVLRDRGDAARRSWQGEVLTRLKASGGGPAPSFAADPAGNLTATWLGPLTPADPAGPAGYPRLHDQAAALLGQWADAARAGLAPEALRTLQDRARTTTDREQREARTTLGG
ncbi:hypothetical protein RMN57_36430 [Kitasatospora sp. CM 4170]|uniref:Uncharacterized protein n=1 Tax=Kitasatospora aburaviensis TaxID=67265 RepID=A0ABW1F8G1_9ACTN|nr:hypothetical protein [Kitasatospora sp. CM 4170]WNM49800.1 hypothetical protein RMN57_36430 [Kitasatospora sp. CM 4170]